MTQCLSTAYENRVWGNLVDKETGQTLQLDPGESADVGIWVEPTDKDGAPIVGPSTVEDLPEDFGYENAFLEQAPAPSSPPAPAKAKGPSPAADSAVPTPADAADAPKE